MSAALNKAIVARLRGTEVLTGEALEAQTRYVSLVSTRTRLGNFASTVAYPQVCFRPSGGVNSWISRSEELGVVSQPEYDFEVWDNTRGGDDIPVILDLIEQLLDDRRSVAPVMTLDSGYHVASMEMIMDGAILYNSTINAWFGLTRYMAREQRYKQGS
jgi:hypothetical protein